ncbi:unnamed protein product, partial [Polarella glacialis]
DESILQHFSARLSGMRPTCADPNVHAQGNSFLQVLGRGSMASTTPMTITIVSGLSGAASPLSFASPIQLQALGLCMMLIAAGILFRHVPLLVIRWLISSTPDEDITNLAKTNKSQAESHTVVLEPAVAVDAMPVRTSLLDELAGDPKEPSDTQHLQIAFANAATGISWTYAHLREVIASEAWAGFATYSRVALVLPAGEELAIALLCLMARTECAPLDPNLSEAEVTAALRQLGAEAVLLCPSSAPGAVGAAARLALPVYHLKQASSSASAELKATEPGKPLSSPSLEPERSLGTTTPAQTLPLSLKGAETKLKGTEQWKTPQDVVLVLRTSGTTGQSKVVPLRLGQLIHGAKCIAASMGLDSHDVCLNAMPLFHIGGISCNLLATLVSGGTVTCLNTSFETRSFLKALSQAGPLQPTWYYASPSMHLVVAESYVDQHSLRLVRSGAAALPPAFQERLESLFKCQVLATYSMSECMPVASPVCSQPFDGVRCQPLGSVGRLIGPCVEIREGEVMLRGPLVMKAYEGPLSGWTEQGLFPTGDLGHIDGDGFLWLSGRKKEIINRGGETLAPATLEEIAKQHEAVKEAAAYAVPHARLGEAVAMALILRTTSKARWTIDLLSIAKEIEMSFSKSGKPALITFVDDLPRTSTGKVQRLALHRRLHLSGFPVELSGKEGALNVLDARGSIPALGLATCRYLTPEPGTVAAIFEMDSAGDEQEEQQLDSLGMVSSFSKRKAFDLQTLSYIYIFGLVGVTCYHWAGFGSPSLWKLFDASTVEVLKVFGQYNQ